MVDLRDNIDCQPCGLNLSEGCARTAAMVGIYNGILDHTVPANAGSFRRVDVLLRENCVVGIPRHPHSCSVATTNLADRVANPVQRAIAEIAPGYGMADTGPIMPPAMGVISGKDPRHDNAAFVNQIFLAPPVAPARRSPTGSCRSSMSAMLGCADRTASRLTSCTTRSLCASATSWRTPRVPVSIAVLLPPMPNSGRWMGAQWKCCTQRTARSTRPRCARRRAGCTVHGA